MQPEITVIPNPLPLAELQAPMPPRQVGTQEIVAVSRLDPQKGFDILLHAFARIAAKAPGWHLTVYREWDMRDALIALRDSP